ACPPRRPKSPAWPLLPAFPVLEKLTTQGGRTFGGGLEPEQKDTISLTVWCPGGARSLPGRSKGGPAMTRFFNSPFLLGFENLEKLLERTAKHAGEGYPPYNIEAAPDGGIAITLAVAGFARDELSVTVEDHQLVIRGRQQEPTDKTFL